jgi:hypothetical protein
VEDSGGPWSENLGAQISKIGGGALRKGINKTYFGFLLNFTFYKIIERKNKNNLNK